MFDFFRKTTLFLVGFTLPIQAFSLLPSSFFGFTPFKLATAFLLFLAIFQFAVGGRRLQRDRKAAWVVAFMVSFVLSSVVGFMEDAPLRPLILMGTTFASLFLYYFLIGYVVQTRDDLVLILWALVLGGVLTTLPAAAGLEAGTGSLAYGKRFEGLSGQENLLGFDMAVCLPVALGLLAAERRGLRRLVLGGVTVAVATGLLLSLSRSAFVSAAGMWGLWIYRSRRIDTLKYLPPALVVLVALLLFAPSSVYERVDTVVDPAKRAHDGSIGDRMEQYEFGTKALASHPLVGVGVHNYLPWARKQPGGAGITQIHSGYFWVAGTQGLLGLIPYLALLALTWGDYTRCWRAAQARRRLKDRRLAELGHYAIFLQVAMFGTMIAGVFTHSHKSKTAWLLFALSTVVVRLVRERVHALDGRGSRREPDLHPASMSALGAPASPSDAY